MKTILYITINQINQKIYIGIHDTENPEIFDGYLGCGCNRNIPSSYKKSKTAFQYALNKYGVDAFKRYTLKVYDTREEALRAEQEIVDEEFIKRKDTYNMIVGGINTPVQSVEVHQYDLSGKYIQSWDSILDAAEIHGCSDAAIGSAIKFKTTSMRYLWSKDKCEQLDVSEFIIDDIREIYEYGFDGNYITKYNSTIEIASKYNINIATINRGIQGKYKVLGKYYSLKKFDKFIAPKSIKIRDSKIYLYNLDGSFYKEYESPISCAKSFGLKNSSEISSAIRLQRTFKGYQVSIEKIEFMKNCSPKNQKQEVDQFDLDGNYIKTFNSITEAINLYGQGVKRVIKGHNKHCKNFIFKLKEVNDIVYSS